jgi:hypothetical protein
MQDSYSARYNLTKFLFPAAILLCFIIAYWTSYQKMSIRWSGGGKDEGRWMMDERRGQREDGGRTRDDGRKENKKNQNRKRFESLSQGLQ